MFFSPQSGAVGLQQTISVTQGDNMSETRNIVVLGASWAGLSVAHYFLKHIYSAARVATPEAVYKVVLIDPSTHFYWRVGAPRALVSTKLMPHEKTFTPIAQGFKQYPSDRYTVLQGEAVAIDTAGRTVTYKNKAGDNEETISYYSLVIATGTKTPSPLTGLQGEHTISVAALDEMNKLLPAAKEIVLAGGGPVAVETAGEIGEALNGVLAKGQRGKVKITVVTGNDQLLPVLRPALSKKAEQLLARVGVDVLYKTRVTKAESSSRSSKENENGTGNGPPAPISNGASGSGKTTVYLDNGKTIEADIYIPATGVTPNTSFLPASLLDSRGYVKTNKQTLRVDEAGPRVYCLGDAGNYTRGGVLDLYAAMPCLGINMSNDLAVGFGDAKAHTGPSRKDKLFVTDTSETQFVPVGRTKGVGAFKGWRMPSIAVYNGKGKDYRVSTRGEVTEGTKWIKASG